MAICAGSLNPTSILETAAGTGRVTSHLSQRLSETIITAADLNPDMLAVAKERISDKNIVWQRADAINLPFQDNNFDIVVAQFGIMFYPDKLVGMKEAYRVLKSAGNYLFSVWDKIEHNLMTQTARGIVMDFFENDPPEFYNIRFSFNDATHIFSMLNDAGFTNIKYEILNKAAIATSAEIMAEGMVSGNPIANAIRERNPDAVETLRIKVFRALVEKFGDFPCKSTMQAILFSAQK